MRNVGCFLEFVTKVFEIALAYFTKKSFLFSFGGAAKAYKHIALAADFRRTACNLLDQEDTREIEVPGQVKNLTQFLAWSQLATIVEDKQNMDVWFRVAMFNDLL